MIRMAKKKGKHVKSGTPDPKSDKEPDVGIPAPAFSLEGTFTSVKTNRYLQILIGLTLIGIFLRFYNLGWNSLWLDEASNLGIARLSLDGI